MNENRASGEMNAGGMDERPDQNERVAFRPASVVRNTLWLLVFHLSSKLFGFLSFVLLAHYLAMALFGVYNYAVALTALFIPLCDMGMDAYLLREAPRLNRARLPAYFTAALVWKAILGIGIIALIGSTATAIDGWGTFRFQVVLLIGISTFFRAVWITCGMFYRSLNNVKVEVLLLSGSRGLEFLAVLVCVVTRMEIIPLLAVTAAANVVPLVAVLWHLARSGLLSRRTPDGAMMRSLLAGGAPFVLTALCTTISFNIDTVLISKIVGDASAAIYRSAYNLVLPFIMISAAASGSIFPYVSQNFRSRPEEIGNVLHRTVHHLLVFAIPIAVLVTVFARDIMHFLYTAEYGSGDVSLAILIWFIPVVYLTQLLGSVLGAMDQQRAVFRVSVANVLFNLCANLVLIPMWREAGAAVVTVLTETLGLVLLSIRLRRSIPVLYSVRSIVLILLATVPGAACALLPSFLPFLVRASAAVVATALCLWLLRLITPDDVRRMLAGAGKPAERPPDRQAGDAA